MKTRSPYLNYIADYMLTRQYSLRTINAFLGWIAKFILFHNKRHPSSMGDAEVKAFLDHIVLKRNMSPRTQSTALNALAFLYKHIVKNELSLNLNFARSNRQPKLPVVMTPDEVKQSLTHLHILQRATLCKKNERHNRHKQNGRSSMCQVQQFISRLSLTIYFLYSPSMQGNLLHFLATTHLVLTLLIKLSAGLQK